MKIVSVFNETPNEISIYVSSKERPARSPYPCHEIDKIHIQPRSLKRDILADWPLHVAVNILFVGIPLLGYVGFWAYERCVPLWDVRITYTHLSELTASPGRVTELCSNPLFTVLHS